NELLCQCSHAIDVTVCPAIRNPSIAARPAKRLKSLPKNSQLRLSLRIFLSGPHQHADAPRPLRLLRAPDERPRCRAPNQRNELPPPHWNLYHNNGIRISDVRLMGVLAIAALQWARLPTSARGHFETNEDR